MISCELSAMDRKEEAAESDVLHRRASSVRGISHLVRVSNSRVLVLYFSCFGTLILAF